MFSHLPTLGAGLPWGSTSLLAPIATYRGAKPPGPVLVNPDEKRQNSEIGEAETAKSTL